MVHLLPEWVRHYPLLIALLAALLIMARYVVVAGGALALVTAFRQRLAHRRIQNRQFTRTQLWREFGWSMSTVVIFAGFATFAATVGREAGLSRVYFDPLDYGAVWLALSFPAVVLLHDTYFYWMHRAMHLPGIFERVHRVHHLSSNPSPLSALAFHPIEAVIEGGAVLVVTLLLPVHIVVLAAWAFYTLLTNVMGHLGYELLPARLARSPWLGWLNTATSHNQHHRSFTANYGLHTLLWDRVMGTTHLKYLDLFDATTGRPRGPHQEQLS